MNRFMLLIAVLAIAACSSAGGATGSPATPDGHTYLSTELDGADLVPGTQVRLAFIDGNLTANAGCNTIGGAYTMDGNRLLTTQLSMTEMGCDEQRARQDAWLAAFLGAGPTMTLADTSLTLIDGTITLTLLDEEVATPDQPLEGTLWVLDGIVLGDAVSSIPVGVTASLQISAGRADVNAGCNRGGGVVEIAPDRLTFGPMMLTKMACEAWPGDIESAVVTVLAGAVEYTINAGTLIISAGDAGLIFLAS